MNTRHFIIVKQFRHGTVPTKRNSFRLLQLIMINFLRTKRIPAVNQNNLLCHPAQQQSIRHSRISAAYHSHSLVPVEHSVTGRTIGYPPAHQFFFTR